MKNLILFLTFSLITQMASAADILCSLTQNDTRYKIAFDSEVSDSRELIRVIMVASSISASEAGEQSQYLVGQQLFTIKQEDEFFMMDRPILEGTRYDFTKIIFSEEGPEDLTLIISGPALRDPLTFTNCLIAE